VVISFPEKNCESQSDISVDNQRRFGATQQKAWLARKNNNNEPNAAS